MFTAQFSFMLNGQPSEMFKSKRGIRQGDPISPVIFVIGMEYLSRILQATSRSSNFNYHPRCKKLGLNHLIFADDLMLMCKGETSSIKVLTEIITTFSKTSRLTANLNKSAMFLAGMDTSQKQVLVHKFQLPLDKLTVKYLGVPLTSKRIATMECDVLVDKMAEKN